MTLLRGNLSSGTNARGVLGFKGNDGDSAYDIAVKNGYEGTEQEWIAHFGLDLTNYLQTTDIVNNLTSDSTTKPLSAASGKVLKLSVDSKINTTKIANNLTTNDGNYVLSAAMGYTLKNNLDTTNTNINTKIGTLSNLETTEKTNLVGSINEVYDSLDDEKEIDITSEITWYETIANTHVIKKGNMIFVYYQGEAKTHSANDVIAKLPEAYTPALGQQYAPFIVNNGAYGTIFVSNSGNISIGMISSSTYSGRIYANFSFVIGIGG